MNSSYAPALNCGGQLPLCQSPHFVLPFVGMVQDPAGLVDSARKMPCVLGCLQVKKL